MRSYTGKDGQSHLETVEVKGNTMRSYSNKSVLTQFDLGDPTRALIAFGHPAMEIPQHSAPYPEKFPIVAGSSTIELPDAPVREIKSGTLFFSEDTTGAGRLGWSGPRGYISIDLQYKDISRK